MEITPKERHKASRIIQKLCEYYSLKDIKEMIGLKHASYVGMVRDCKINPDGGRYSCPSEQIELILQWDRENG